MARVPTAGGVRAPRRSLGTARAEPPRLAPGVARERKRANPRRVSAGALARSARADRRRTPSTSVESVPAALRLHRWHLHPATPGRIRLPPTAQLWATTFVYRAVSWIRGPESSHERLPTFGRRPARRVSQALQPTDSARVR